ncbi:putative calcium-binding protein CML27 [Raphanus sativus]|uniref:Probable calcium-binding protein CML27 n=1 Tax=Raphanus sativus TaxID=3726 RepID=A0A6J0KR32_RAPSA|nr:probable calcium-binding protein CML27 [Raphanus sativus]XP_056857542.1 probable calcium-binding protein CML27 [Raphanus sativus]KAJ4866460.1 putative calcium-binding protein CML27 [Raphanus sativus]KAJ4879452.1 putative calcium-binding protein CML27 [Raphanus sativus]
MATANPETAKATPASVDTANPEDLKKVFDQFDSNGDGKISASELGGVFKAMGTSYTEAELTSALEDVDADRDGFIDVDEFSTLCRSSSTASEIRDAFDLYDHDKNGLISASELHQVLNRLGMSCSAEECSRMIGTVDADGDGNVNFEEFQKMMTSSSSSLAYSNNGSTAAANRSST